MLNIKLNYSYQISKYLFYIFDDFRLIRDFESKLNLYQSINQSINQIYLPGKYYKNSRKKAIYKKITNKHFPGGKYNLTEVVFK